MLSIAIEYVHSINQRFRFVMWSLLMYVLAHPLLVDTSSLFLNLLLTLLITSIPVTAAFALGKRRKRFYFMLIFSIPFILDMWARLFHQDPIIALVGDVFGVLFFGYLAYVFLKTILTLHHINIDTLYASVSTYLVIGIAFAEVFSIISFFDRTAFTQYPINTIYYSFTTITTLGYGDIAPISRMAMSMSIVETLMGVLYTTVVLARIVGMYMSLQLRSYRKIHDSPSDPGQ